jgi:hypothetical protein
MVSQLPLVSTFRRSNPSNLQTLPYHCPFVSNTYKLSLLQLLSFDIHANWWGGVWGYTGGVSKVLL